MNNNKLFKTMQVFLALLLVTSFVSAFGVSSPYYESNPMSAYKGQDTTINLNLQNYAGATDDVVARVSLINGSAIVSLDEKDYVVEANSNIDVPVRIRIPSDAKTGDVYSVKIDVKTVTPGTSGGVGLGTGMSTNFDVIVSGDKPKEAYSSFNYNYLWVVLVLLIIIILVVLYYKKKIKRK